MKQFYFYLSKNYYIWLVKKIASLLILNLLLFSCQENKSDTDNTESQNQYISFSNEIYPNKTDWSLDSIYIDTLELFAFDRSYDYPYAIFKTKNGNTASMVYDKKLNPQLRHNMFVAEWKIDSFPEKEDPNTFYYDEHLLKCEMLGGSSYFGDFLKDFMKAYSNDDNELIKDYVSEEVGFNTTHKEKTFCLIDQVDFPETKAFMSKTYGFYDEMPLGTACDGYSNFKNGLYFTTIDYNDVPWFEIPKDDKVRDMTFKLNSSYCDNEIKKLSIILDEQLYVDLYFIKVDGQWFLWAEDKCRC